MASLIVSVKLININDIQIVVIAKTKTYTIIKNCACTMYVIE